MDQREAVAAALSFMDRHLRDDLRVETVARAAHFSTSHFHLIFARHVGCTVAEHLRKRRLSAAAMELALSQRGILDIALEYRFDSQESFSRAFKRQYGITPGIFRRHRIRSRAVPRLGVYGASCAPPHAPAQFAGQPRRDAREERLVLEGVLRVGFDLGPVRCPETIPFPSCLASALRYVGEDFAWVPIEAHGRTWQLNWGNVHILGSSGMAFGLLWRTGWHMDNVDVMFAADPRDLIDRAFASVGYSYEILRKTGDPEDEVRYRAAIQESLSRGRPVLAFGVIGPPECCLITGYDEGGDVLIGWNYFQTDPDLSAGLEFEPGGYFSKRNWFADTVSIVLIGDRTAAFEGAEARRAALEWAVEVARTPERMGRHSGFAAYTAWAEQLSHDDEFPSGDEAVLRQRHQVHFPQAGTLAELRAWAAAYLRRMADLEPAMAGDLLAAADCYSTEHDLMWQVWELAGGPSNPDAWRNLARPEVRRRIIPVLLQARELDMEAVAHLERALKR